MSHHRTDEARALLAGIEAWCARTATPETAVGHALFRHPGFVGLLRLRLQLSEEKERAVRAFMGAWPRGYHGELPNMFLKTPKVRQVHPIRESAASKLSEAEIAARRVDRDCCPRCGTRADLGCKHSRAPIGTAFG